MPDVDGNEAPPLTFEDIVPVIRQVFDLNVTLVGGQAVNHWAEHYLSQGRAPELTSLGPFTSEDIDFLGSPHAAEVCARRLPGASIHLAGLDDVTVNTAVVMFKDQRGYAHRIDFLRSVGGVADDDLRKTVRIVSPMSHPDLRLNVMHPRVSLESRAHNIVSLGGRYRSQHGINQYKAAVVTTREYILDLLSLPDDDAVRVALDVINKIAAFAESDVGVDVVPLTGTDPLEAVPIDDPRLPEALREKQWPRVLERVKLARSKRPRE